MNIIIGYSTHIFTLLYIDTLVKKCGINKRNICLLSLDNTPENFYLDQSEVKVFNYNYFSKDALLSVKSITLMSLVTNNAAYIRELFEYSDTFIDKTYIHLTDDEVARWVKTKNTHGKLQQTRNNNLNEDCLFLLTKNRHFIAPKQPFREYLEYVLERDNFNLYDARDAFKTMPSELWDKFKNVYRNRHTDTLPENKILIGAKRDSFSQIDTFKIIKALNKKGLFPHFKCLIFVAEKRQYFKLLLTLYSLYLKYFKRIDLNITCHGPANNVTYNSLVMSCSHLILQGRGSMTTARSFLSVGNGVIHIKENTPNDIELTKAEGVNVAKYLTFDELAEQILNTKINVKSNSDVIELKYLNKYEVLESIYT